MKRIFQGFILLLASSVTAAITTYVYHKVAAGGIPADDIKYQDFVSISLTALGLMMTILGFFVAVASVIGWATFEGKLRDHSINYFKEQLSENGELRAELEKLITDIAYQGVENVKDKQLEEGENEYND